MSIPVQVEVTDGTYPIRGAQVDFAVTSGGGTLDVPNQTTNNDGLATLGGWKLGDAGVNTVTATVRGTGLTTTFTANAAALQVKALNKVDGDNQTGFYGNMSPKRSHGDGAQPVRRASRGRRGHVQHDVGRRHAPEDASIRPVPMACAEVGAWRFGNTALAVDFGHGGCRIAAAAGHFYRNRYAGPRLDVQDRGAVSRR